MQPRADKYRDDIAKALATEGGHLDIGRGGATLYFGQGWLSSHNEEQLKAECVVAGLPVIDSRMVPIEAVWDLTVRGPMIAVGRKPSEPPYHALSYAPLSVVAEAYRLAGAEVLNCPPPVVLSRREEEGCAELRDG